MAKDKNKPKGAMSAYICFVQDSRKKTKSAVNFTEFSKDCAEKWKTMSAKEKKRFEDMAAADRARFDREMATYTPDPASGKRGAKRKKDPNQPKRAWSAFFFFSDEFRPIVRKQHPDWKVGDVAKELGRRWEACTNKDKYEQKAAADKKRYEEEMKQYKSGGGGKVGGKKAKADAGPSNVAGDDESEEDDDEEEEDDE